MKSAANNIDTWEWWNSQPLGKWLNIKDIPSSIFITIWNLKIEGCHTDLHPTEAKYKINLKY